MGAIKLSLLILKLIDKNIDIKSTKCFCAQKQDN